MSKTVFLTGATGYIGGATLASLLETPSTRSYKYAVLVRNKQKAALLEPLGVRPVVGTFDDVAVITSEAEKADIIIHTANSADDLQAAQVLLSGMKKGGKNPIYIHISGTGVIVEDTHGEPGSGKVYSDLEPAHINALPDDVPHRPVDLTVIGAASYARTHIVLPPMIYGVADHALVKAGIANPLSIQIPILIRAGIDRGQGPAIGKGLNVWSNVHIDDLAGVIVTVVEGAVGGMTATGREGYYFGETGENKLRDVYAEVARVLSAHGIGTPEPTPLTEAEIQKYSMRSYAIDATSRCKAERTPQLGWSPVHTADDLIKDIALEVEYILKTEGKKRCK